VVSQVSLHAEGLKAGQSHLPADIPGLCALVQRGTLVAHLEDVAQALELRLVREELATAGTRPLAAVQRFEEREGEYLGRRPVCHGIGYHHRLARIRVAARKA